MNQYFFALGTNHSLSKIDIINTLLRKGVDFEILEASEEILIISTSSELSPALLINELGSAVKIGKIEKVYLKDENWEDFFDKELGNQKFGLSLYHAGGRYREIDEIFEKTKKLKKIREKGRILSSVTVDQSGLLKKPASTSTREARRGGGFELVICVGAKGVYFGKTLAVQDYESYSRRDYGRPSRDAQSGMIPPKLAKMMINLAGRGKDELLLDPFCGCGTILQELTLLGYKNIMGADIEDRAVTDSQKNLDWLFETFKLEKADFKINIFKSDARALSAKISQNSVNAIVTEPYLGSSQARYLSLDQIKKEIQKLEDLYLAVFGEFKKVLKDSGRVVIIFPVFRYKAQFFKLQILDILKNQGYKQAGFLAKKVKGEELLKLQITDRKSIIYFRPGQSVSREIFVFENTSWRVNYLTKNIT
ncbi:hypothetical protein COV89_02985 [Candidatus Shapirobacteria bacterium CG11_big_fil_rev_8_21_14_0_20_40_12]|uniref:Ribosomal RNA large subunit methyltransferase K/L-like methyltransferase domain-containing protein n=1 Tax=Candidatus Shapirobacteria bacterium CG11_big_fil_rev_8_21_14_0_20_40_12 TaxID=1974889 RepID=A0A2H0KFG4_9BACT|nr:MAG: hypothetical protein COV89_02985 [Candidatus Shapirobacteria bacterium CG11_big_fil_rev_8_21_14_0_20_40_12]